MEINAIATDSLSWRRLVLPIRLGIDPMEKLLVASFKGDPEFEGFEPQVFDDPINGKGMRVLRYRKDGKVDVYWQPCGVVLLMGFVKAFNFAEINQITQHFNEDLLRLEV